MNGEPLLDKRLPSLISTAKKYTGTQSVIDTNGAATQNRDMLLHPDLKLVRFTISAASKETYRKVHGKDLFEEAVNNFFWFNKNKHPSQTAWLHFITTSQNEHEVDRWLKMFEGYGRTVFPVHVSPLQQNSIKSKSAGWQPRPYAVLADGRKTTSKPVANSVYPCPCWSIMGISWRGEILQCCDYPYKYNYGKVGEVDLDEAWRERNRVGFDNDCCRSCSLKFTHGKELLKKYSRNT
jgi:MoaA/NifB/PqqE/SkfB family radical SAM enzyme